MSRGRTVGLAAGGWQDRAGGARIPLYPSSGRGRSLDARGQAGSRTRPPPWRKDTGVP